MKILTMLPARLASSRSFSSLAPPDPALPFACPRGGKPFDARVFAGFGENGGMTAAGDVLHAGTRLQLSRNIQKAEIPPVSVARGGRSRRQDAPGGWGVGAPFGRLLRRRPFRQAGGRRHGFSVRQARGVAQKGRKGCRKSGVRDSPAPIKKSK